MRTEEWTRLRFSWLQRGIYSRQCEISGLMIRDARQTGENTYEYESEEYRPLNRGDLIFTPDGTVFIRGSFAVPKAMRKEKPHLVLKTAAEMIVRINGRFSGGFDPNRERIDLSPYMDSGILELEMEGYNRSKPDDERNTATLSLRGCRQIFDGLRLACLRENVLSLIYDCTLFMDIADCEYFHADYRKSVWDTLSDALDLVDFETWEGVDAALSHLQNTLYADNTYKGSGTVALVGHSHLDLAYYWRRIHSVQKNARTVLIQLRLMERYPEYRYTHTQAYLYETLEKYYPEIFEELRERVRSGQFEPVGAMYVEPDCNLPAAESLIRQLLYGQHYFRRAFGKTIDNAWLPDVFGNSWILPQILVKSGVSFFVSNKMSTWNDTNRFPHNNFIWKGIDGSTVYACVPPTHFITWNMPSQIQENWEAFQDKETGTQTLSMFGYGDGGSGATEEMLELARRFQRIPVMPKTEILGGSEFLNRNLKGNKKLPVWDGELYLEMHRGTFTTKSNLKRANRKLEFMLREAELVCSLAALAGNAYPEDVLRDCWKKVLINQFHDILPGSHIHPVYEDAMSDYRAVETVLSDLMDNYRGRQYFNSLNFRRGSVTFIPHPSGTVIRRGVSGFWAIPGLAGLTRGNVLPLKGKPGWLSVSTGRQGRLNITTAHYIIRLRRDGSFASLYDRDLEREWVKEGCGFNRLHLYRDEPGLYDAWDILPGYRKAEVPLNVSSALSLTAQDDVSAEFSVEFSTGNSSWRMIIRLFADSRAIEVEHIADWNEKHKLMKVNFGPDVLTRELVCDTSVGFIKRDLTKNTSWQEARYEVCHHKWFDLSETGCGLAVINDGKYGVGLEGDEVSLSLLRATERPDISSDIGRHSFCCMILPHAGDAVTTGVNHTALEYNIPLRQASVSAPEPLRKAFSDCGLCLQAMKRSEDGETLVLRLSEQYGRRGKLALPFPVYSMNLLEDIEGEIRELEYKPFELLTIGIRPELLR